MSDGNRITQQLNSKYKWFTLTSIFLMLLIVMAIAEPGFAYNHVIQLYDNAVDLNPLVGYEVEEYVKTGPGDNDWTMTPDITNGAGQFTVSISPHSTGVFWWYDIVDANWVNNPHVFGPINYMTLFHTAYHD